MSPNIKVRERRETKTFRIACGKTRQNNQKWHAKHTKLSDAWKIAPDEQRLLFHLIWT